VQEGTPLGKQIAGMMEQGSLVPDAVALQLISEYLDENDLANGFLFDGFPRSIDQAEKLRDILQQRAIALHFVLHLQIEPEAVIRRLSGRRSCPNCGRIYNIYFDAPKVADVCDDCGYTGQFVHRTDDNEQSIRHRLQVYESQTQPLLSFYENTGLLHSVDASGPVEEIAERIERVIQLQSSQY